MVPLVGQRLEYLREIERKKDRAARSILLYADASTDYDHIHNFSTQFGSVESIDTAHIHSVSNEVIFDLLHTKCDTYLQ